MPVRPRFDHRQSSHTVRPVLGIDVSPRCRRVLAAPLAAYGNGLHMGLRAGRAVAIDLPGRAAELKTRLDATSGANGPDPFAALAELRAILTEHAAIAAQESAAKNASALSEMLVIGVNEPGKITAPDGGPACHIDLVDPARLADLSGVNVVSGFPARDLAAGGRGAPLSPLPLWILFRSDRRRRIFLHLGRTVHLALLPQMTGSLSTVCGLGFRATPGTSLLDLLVQELTNGRRQVDLGGRMAVQGRRVDELIDHWHLLSERLGAATEDDSPGMLRSAVSMAVERGWSVYDMLCSASHFVAEAAARGLEQLAGDSGPVEVILAGGGLANGLILRHLTARLSRHSLLRVEQLGGQSEVVPAAVAATLAVLHLDQVPANVAGLTGAETPRVLGNLTPAGPLAWQRLLTSCTSGGHSIRPLRAAM